MRTGELVVNSIDPRRPNDGVRPATCRQSRHATNLPITLGWIWITQDIDSALIKLFGAIVAAAGSLFVFMGHLRAVLINYPSRAEKDALVLRAP
jgi:imidazole glycerol-phosphate synthase subunit HisF